MKNNECLQVASAVVPEEEEKGEHTLPVKRFLMLSIWWISKR